MKRKRWLIAVFVLMMAIVIVGCGGKENNSNAIEQNSSIADANNSKADKDVIEVDKNLFNVEITIPASLIADDDPEQIKAEAEREDGILEVTINSDGSITYKMTKAAHSKMMDDAREEMENTIREILDGGDFPSIVDIKTNRSFAEFTMVVDREKFENSFDGFAAFGLGIGSMFYQVFDGADVDTAKTTIHVEDVSTGEIFSTIVYPDDLNL